MKHLQWVRPGAAPQMAARRLRVEEMLSMELDEIIADDEGDGGAEAAGASGERIQLMGHNASVEQ